MNQMLSNLSKPVLLILCIIGFGAFTPATIGASGYWDNDGYYHQGTHPDIQHDYRCNNNRCYRDCAYAREIRLHHRLCTRDRCYRDCNYRQPKHHRLCNRNRCHTSCRYYRNARNERYDRYDRYDRWENVRQRHHPRCTRDRCHRNCRYYGKSASIRLGRLQIHIHD